MSYQQFKNRCITTTNIDRISGSTFTQIHYSAPYESLHYQLSIIQIEPEGIWEFYKKYCELKGLDYDEEERLIGLTGH